MTRDTEVDDYAREASQGNAGAFEELVRRLTPVLIGFFRRRAVRDAEELTQQTWFRVASGIDRYDCSRDFKRWLFAIAYHEMVNDLRSQGKEPLPLVAQFAAVSVETHCSEEELLQRLHDCINELPAEERAIIFKRYWENLGLDVIGERLGIPYGRLKGLAFRTTKRLRKCMGSRHSEEFP